MGVSREDGKPNFIVEGRGLSISRRRGVPKCAQYDPLLPGQIQSLATPVAPLRQSRHTKTRTVSSYDLSRLEPSTFEHMVVSLALRELGAGVTMFGPGADGGRDGFFDGEANYPSSAEHWKGRWYIQSKFHAPGLTDDAQSWLRKQIALELSAFGNDPKREWPDNWIVITNVDPSPTPKTGTFDATREMVESIRPQLAPRFHIWGAKKIDVFLSKHKDLAERYGEFLTAGDVMQAMYHALQDDKASAERIVRHLIVGQIVNQAYAKLEQVGKSGDMPGLHRLFTDVPFRAPAYELDGIAAEALAGAGNRNQRPSTDAVSGDAWRTWRRHPVRARTWFVRGGPGQGKSTLGQFVAQVQRAWFVLQQNFGPLTDAQQSIAREVRDAAINHRIWPASGRIPVLIELKDYAQWLGALGKNEPRGVLTYLSQQWRKGVQQDVPVGLILRLLAQHRWFVVFDGLDEVPQDVKDDVAKEVRTFLDQDVHEKDADLLVLCTSRPQGYSGQFDLLDAVTIDLTPLTIEQALHCAEPLLRFQQSDKDAERDVAILEEASGSASVKQLMTTPLQSHIMAVVVRGGQRPPERRWKLFDNFYDVILKREANRPGIDPKLATIFKSHDDLLKTIHNRLGFVLHASAERSTGAVANLSRAEFEQIVRAAAQEMLEGDVEPKVKALIEATTDRLVLVNTPDDGNSVRFDVRQLQEFFAAEFLREDDPGRPVSMQEAFELLGADAHWREVTHFLLSALVEEKQWRDIDALASVLQRFDDGDGEDRLLRRRMARGALAVARLLAEGVLEQDKRVRGQLRAALLPTLGTVDPSVLEVLWAVNQPQSRNWLLDVLIDSMKTLSRPESMGAAVVLLRLMSAGDPRAAQTQQLLSDMPSSGLALLSRLAPVTSCVWFVELILDRFRSARSLGLSIEDLFWVLRSFTVLARPGRSTFTDAVGLRANHREQLLLSWLMRHAESSHSFPERSMDVPDTFRRHPESVADVPSLLGTLDAIIRFASEPSVATLRAAAAVFTDASSDIVELLPNRLLRHIPIDWRAADFREQLLPLVEADDADLLALRKRRKAVERDRSRPKPMLRPALIERLPTLTLQSLAEKPGQPPASYLKSLIRSLLQSPSSLLREPGLWGLLVANAADLEQPLRAAIRAAARAMSPVGDEKRRIRLFSLVVPDDAPLLPHLINSGVMGSVVMDFCGDVNALRAVRDNPAGPEAERLGAALFAASHPDGAGVIETWPFLRTVSLAAHPWCLNPIIVLLDQASPDDSRSVEMAVYLVDVLRDYHEARLALDSVIGNWRERSLAPVTAAGVLDAWVHRAALAARST